MSKGQVSLKIRGKINKRWSKPEGINVNDTDFKNKAGKRKIIYLYTVYIYIYVSIFI